MREINEKQQQEQHKYNKYNNHVVEKKVIGTAKIRKFAVMAAYL